MDALHTVEGENFILVKKIELDSMIIFDKIRINVGMKTDRWFEVLNPETLSKTDKEILIKGGYNLSGNI